MSQEQEEPPELQSARQQLAEVTDGNDADTINASVTEGMQPPWPHGVDVRELALQTRVNVHDMSMEDVQHATRFTEEQCN